MIKFRCKHCGKKLGADEKYAGRRVRCSKCKEPIRVPQPVAEAAKDSAFKQQASPETPTSAEMGENSIFEGLEDSLEDEDARRMEAIQMARQDRTARKSKAVKFSGKTSKAKKPGKSASKSGGGSGMMAFADMVPPVLAFPLSLLTCLVLIGVVTGIWVAASRAAESRLGFFAVIAFAVPAFGLRLFMVNRGILLGMLGLIISIGGLGVAKTAIANYAVKPYYEKISNEEILAGIDKILKEAGADGKGQAESVRPFASNGTYRLCVGLIYMVDEKQLDPVKARRWMIPMLKRTSPPGDMSKLLGETTPIPAVTESSEEKSEAVMTASGIVFDWDEEKLLLRKTKKYLPVLEKLIIQAENQKILADSDKTFKYCLAQTFGFLDILWILVGMGLTFVILAFD